MRKLRKKATAAAAEPAVIRRRCILRIAALAEAHAMLLSLREGRISQIILALESRFAGCNTSFCGASYINRDLLGREEQTYALASPDRLLPE